MAKPAFTSYAPVEGKPGMYRFERGTRPPVDLYGTAAEEAKRSLDAYNAAHAVASNAHQAPRRSERTFEMFDNAVPLNESRYVNRAMAQDEHRPDPIPQSVAEQYAYDQARSPLNPDRARVEAGEAKEREAAARANPRSGGRAAAFGRAAVTRAGDALMAPVTLPAQAVEYATGKPNDVAQLSTAEAVADAESLARGETTAESRERARLGRDAYPAVSAAGDIAGDVAAGAAMLGAQRASPAVRAEATRAFGGSRVSQRGAVEVPLPQREAWDRQVEAAPEAFFGPDAAAGIRARAAERPPSLGIGPPVFSTEEDLARARARMAAHTAITQPPPAPKKSFQSGDREKTAGGRLFGVALDMADEESVLSLLGAPGKHTGLTTETTVGADRGRVQVATTLKGKDGGKVADIERTYHRDRSGNLVVNHKFFKFHDPSYKGKGAGKNILREQVAKYDELGVSKINTSAHWDGRYVWPSMGYDLKNPAKFESIKKAWRKWCKNEGYDPGDFDPQNITELARWKPADAPPSSTVIYSQERNAQGIFDKRDPLPVSGKAFLLRPDQAPLELVVDLNGASGARMREYLGLPAKAPVTVKSTTASQSRLAREPAPEISDDAIMQFREEAGAAGDTRSLDVAEAALDGDVRARALVQRWILEAGGTL